jgi:hypothetical protein
MADLALTLEFASSRTMRLLLVQRDEMSKRSSMRREF